MEKLLFFVEISNTFKKKFLLLYFILYGVPTYNNMLYGNNIS